jgi:hypothetical protein
MTSAALEVLRTQVQGTQFVEILRPQAGESIQELR